MSTWMQALMLLVLAAGLFAYVHWLAKAITREFKKGLLGN